MLRRILIAALMTLIATSALAAELLRLATTTSTENSGLLAELLPPFETGNDCQVDVILVHARSREDRFVAEAYGVDRRDVMYNDFAVIGPADDPAGIKGLTDAAGALKKIAAAEATFVSRGDDSGTHTKEKHLWKSAGVTPSASGIWKPDAAWAR